MPGLVQSDSRLPRFVRKGLNETLELAIQDQGGNVQTATAGTFTLLNGSITLVDEASVTTLGPPATYDLLSTVTADETVSTTWQEIWTMTIDGATEVFARPVYLILRELTPVLTDADLLKKHSDLVDLRDPELSSFEVARTSAWEDVLKELIKHGSLPHLIFDAWMLLDYHRYRTFGDIFRNFATSVSDERYRDLADHYDEKARIEFSSLSLSYDYDQDGNVENRLARAVAPVIWLNGGIDSRNARRF